MMRLKTYWNLEYERWREKRRKGETHNMEMTILEEKRRKRERRRERPCIVLVLHLIDNTRLNICFLSGKNNRCSKKKKPGNQITSGCCCYICVVVGSGGASNKPREDRKGTDGSECVVK
jgi:hypothetical protein